MQNGCQPHRFSELLICNSLINGKAKLKNALQNSASIKKEENQFDRYYFCSNSYLFGSIFDVKTENKLL